MAACQAALNTLARLGRSADADELLTDAASSSSYDAIAADTTHTDEWKLQQYAKKYSAVMATLATRLTATANIASMKYKDDAERVFGIKGLPGDPGFLIVSLRDTQDRIEGDHDSIKLQRLLYKAVVNADVVRAHAIVESAVINRDADTVTAFQNAYPDLADAVDRLWMVQNRNPVNTLDSVTGMRLPALKPAPLQRVMDYEIAAAAGQTSAGSWNV